MNPKLRPLETTWVKHNGQMALLLRDKLGLTPNAVVVPSVLAVLLGLCDGSRDEGALRAIFELRTGLRLDALVVHQFISQLEEALMLEGPRVDAARREALREYREGAFRPAALAGQSYSADPARLAEELDEYRPGPDRGLADPALSGSVRGIVTPHIDFLRGGHIYGSVWRLAATAVQDAEVAVVFGTNHFGGTLITPTRQSYATPWGVLPTASWVVDPLVEALGGASVLEGELDHRSEHSIELAAVWLHYIRGGRAVELVPILCGSFQPFTDGEADAGTDPQVSALTETLRTLLGARRYVAVAAADLAHVGPAFGDQDGLSLTDKEDLSRLDATLLKAACTGDADTFLAPLREEKDRRRVCGLPPIYMMLRLLGGARGELTGYDQCPADAEGSSIVSIAGLVYR